MELFYPLYPQYGTLCGMIAIEIQNTLHQHDISVDICEHFDEQLSALISLQFLMLIFKGGNENKFYEW